jgi:NitT/TauT family transport system substrate-binding protein
MVDDMRIRSILLATLAALLIPSLSRAQPTPVKLHVGTYVTISDAGLYIATDKGYFRDEGIEVDFTQVNTGSVVMTSLASESIDVAGGSPGAYVYNAARQGVSVKMVADKGSYRPGYGYIALLTRPDLAGVIKTGADLRGRTVAITGYFEGATMEVVMGKLLAQAGLKEGDVNFINLSFSDVVAGLSSGRVEVGAVIEPLATLAIDKKAGVLWQRMDAIYPNQQTAALMYGPSMAKRPDVGKRFMVAYIKGLRFYNDALTGKASKDELVAILAKHTPVKNRALYDRMVFPGLNPDGALNLASMKSDMEWWVKAGRIKEAVSVDRVIDNQYVAHALQKLGKY